MIKVVPRLSRPGYGAGKGEVDSLQCLANDTCAVVMVRHEVGHVSAGVTVFSTQILVAVGSGLPITAR